MSNSKTRAASTSAYETNAMSTSSTSEHPAFNQSYANRVLILFSLLAAFVLFVDIMLTPSLSSIA